jgi:hypothetical protein
MVEEPVNVFVKRKRCLLKGYIILGRKKDEIYELAGFGDKRSILHVRVGISGSCVRSFRLANSVLRG